MSFAVSWLGREVCRIGIKLPSTQKFFHLHLLLCAYQLSLWGQAAVPIAALSWTTARIHMIRKIIQCNKPKSSQLDVLPAWLVKQMLEAHEAHYGRSFEEFLREWIGKGLENTVVVHKLTICFVCVYFLWTVNVDVTLLINQCFESGVFPAALKKVIVTSLLKKPTLDRSVLQNYRPSSTLPFVAKFIKKAAAKWLRQ